MMNNWIKEIVGDFKKMSLDERIAHLNGVGEHELVCMISEIESQLAKNSILELMFSFSSFMDASTSMRSIDFEEFMFEVTAANDERFALAA